MNSTRGRIALFTGPGKPIGICDVPVPEPQGGEILVRVRACTLCGSDQHTIHGRRATPVPTVLGHEIVGSIVLFGASASRADILGQPLRVGDTITWSIVASCGDCFYCQRSLPQKCERAIKYGHERVDSGRTLAGGLADYCLLVSQTSVVKVPDELSPERICPANCATATIAAGLELLGDLSGRSVLVLGAGMLGITATCWLRVLGAGKIVVCDHNQNRLTRAEEFGADDTCCPRDLPTVVQAATAGYGVDALLEVTGSPAAFMASLPLVRMGGTIITIGSVFPAPPVPLDLEMIVRRCLTLRGVHNYAPRHLIAAVQFLGASTAPFESLVGAWFPLDKVNEAVLAAEHHYRVGVEMGE